VAAWTTPGVKSTPKDTIILVIIRKQVNRRNRVFIFILSALFVGGRDVGLSHATTDVADLLERCSSAHQEAIHRE
jgi:hypothetical protein